MSNTEQEIVELEREYHKILDKLPQGVRYKARRRKTKEEREILDKIEEIKNRGKTSGKCHVCKVYTNCKMPICWKKHLGITSEDGEVSIHYDCAVSSYGVDKLEQDAKLDFFILNTQNTIKYTKLKRDYLSDKIEDVHKFKQGMKGTLYLVRPTKDGYKLCCQ